MPQDRLFDIDMITLTSAGANLVNVAVLAVILSLLLYKPVRNVLNRRTEKIRDQLTQAEEELTKATEMRREYEQKMEEIGREREKILADARKLAEDSSQRTINEAKNEANLVKERAAASVALEWDRAKSEMRTTIIDVSAIMAEKIVSLSINKETHDRLFDEAISDMEGMTWRD